MTFSQASHLSEDEARTYLETLRWPHGPECPRCHTHERISKIQGKSARPGLYHCGACRRQFTVTVGTVMHRSHLTCRQWVMAFHLICASKKGISALQVQRMLGLSSYESAWFLCHRVRAAMEEMRVLTGTVEVDETYVGGKGHGALQRGRGTPKTPVLAMISRDGGTHTRIISRVDGKTLKGAIREVVLPDSRIMTDENYSYRGIGREFAGGHHTVVHSHKEYARGDVHVNNAESYFSLLKRGVHGTFHHVSKKHLGRYCHEFSFRWNRRKITDGQRCTSAISQSGGKRLTYAKLVENDL